MHLRDVVFTILLAGCGATGGNSDPAGPGGPDAPTTPPTNPAPGGAVASIGGCAIFPADNAWNRDVSADPVASNSGALLGVMSPGNAVHLDLGTTEEYYGIPYTVVPAGQPLVPIEYGTDGADYSDESDLGPDADPPRRGHRGRELDRPRSRRGRPARPRGSAGRLRALRAV